MATPDEVQAALLALAARLAAADPEIRRRYCLDRTVSCQVSDLDVRWTGQLGPDGITELTDLPSDRAQVRVSVGSEDLVALAEGRLSPGSAWAAGRLRVQAAAMDLLKLSALL